MLLDLLDPEDGLEQQDPLDLQEEMAHQDQRESLDKGVHLVQLDVKGRGVKEVNQDKLEHLAYKESKDLLEVAEPRE